MIYLTSDTHFGHVNILTYEPKRKEQLGETIELHDANLLNRINSRVRPEDTLFILGDFSLESGGAVARYRAQLKCKTVILVMGNHDKSTITHYYKSGFSVVCYELILKIANEYVRLRHHPYRKPWYKVIFPWQYKEKDRKKRPADRDGFLLHGHIHSGGHKDGAWKVTRKMINVGVDVWNYYPVSIREIESLIAKEKQKKIKELPKYLKWLKYL
jgi:calcineurin-like phosphoesterase family protein